MEVRAVADITENELPGIGKKFTLETAEGGTVTVIVHLTGRRDVYYAIGDEEDPTAFALTDEEARRLSAVLGDTFYKPTPMDILRSALPAGGGIEMVQIRDGSAAAGRTLGELDVRRSTGVTVLGIRRGERTIPNPPASAAVLKDDFLIVMGAPEELRKLDRLIKKG
jgi:TrkA domain protein